MYHLIGYEELPTIRHDCLSGRSKRYRLLFDNGAAHRTWTGGFQPAACR